MKAQKMQRKNLIQDTKIVIFFFINKTGKFNLKSIILVPQSGKSSEHGKYNHNSAYSIA